jgi:hypothetical protein
MNYVRSGAALYKTAQIIETPIKSKSIMPRKTREYISSCIKALDEILGESHGMMANSKDLGNLYALLFAIEKKRSADADLSTLRTTLCDYLKIIEDPQSVDRKIRYKAADFLREIGKAYLEVNKKP